MIRNFELIRSILLCIEKQEKPFNLIEIDFQEHDFPTLAQHVELLVEAGLVKAELSHSDGIGAPIYVRVGCLTWQGYEFLAMAKNQDLWDQALRVIAENDAPSSFTIINALLAKLARQKVDLD